MQQWLKVKAKAKEDDQVDDDNDEDEENDDDEDTQAFNCAPCVTHSFTTTGVQVCLFGSFSLSLSHNHLMTALIMAIIITFIMRVAGKRSLRHMWEGEWICVCLSLRQSDIKCLKSAWFARLVSN